MSYKAILADDSNSFNAFHADGSPVIVTYSFSSRGDLAGTGYTIADFTLKVAARNAFAEMARVCGIRFVEVEPTANEMISIFYNDDVEGTSWANYPYTSSFFPDSSGSIGMNRHYDSYARGEVGYEIMLHELGHAVGLKHPHDGSPTLPASMDNTNRTLMSYEQAGSWKSNYQSLDKQALTYRYGNSSELSGVALHWMAGSDTLQITGTWRSDELIGVNDDNRIYGRNGNDMLVGREGDDTLIGNAHWDTLKGHNGDDSLVGGDAADQMFGGYDNDTLIGQNGNDLAMGGSGDDRAAGGNGTDRMYGEDGNDTLIGDAHNDLLNGGDGNDLLNGGTGGDLLLGGGWWGSDTLIGGHDRDRMYGGDGDDVLWGGFGGDHMFGEDGDDSLYGQGQNDTMNGGDGYDLLDGGAWGDRMRGGNGNDTMFGGDGNDRLAGNEGYDSLLGGRHNDTLFGEGGNDDLFGNAHNDTLNGGVGRDTLTGGTGNDYLVGGPTADIFVLERFGGTDRIADFNPDELDRIDVSDLGVSTFNAFMSLTVSGANMVFQYGSVEAILLGGADTHITQFDFIG